MMTRPADETPFDPSQLKRGLRKIVRTREEQNALEFANVAQAHVKYLGAKPNRKIAPFTLTWARKLHREMFRDVLDRAGRFRRENLNLGVDWQHIETSLHNLLEDVRAWAGSGMPLLEQAARLHHRAVAIHPFANGNGRWSRLLASIWLRLHGEPSVAWPDVELGNARSPIRDEYIAAVRAADEGDIEPLVKLHRRYWQG